MADSISLEIRCLDDKGNPLKVDSVTLDAGGTRDILTKGPFRFSIKAASEGVLEIRKSKHHAWNFPIRISESKGELNFKFHEKTLSAPAMANLSSVAASAAAKKGKEYICDFTIGDCKEAVLVSGFDYHGGSANIAYATTRMHELWAAKTIDVQTLISVFDCDTGMLERWVKGSGKEKTSKQKFTSGWCLLEKVLQGTVAPVLHPHGGDPGPDSISIRHVYRHIEDCGRNRPASVIEFGIFSHSWFGGPILFNTSERAEYDVGGASYPNRDPLDHDARFWKDFKLVNMPNRADFKAAFSATSFLKIWGCLAVTVYRNMLNKARKAKNDVTPLGVDAADRTDYFTGVVHPDTRPGILAYLKNSSYKANFMYTLSKVTGRSVWGGAPGTGALLLSNGTWNWMYMPEYQLEYKGGKRVNKTLYYLKELHYMKSDLGWTFSPDWYLEYK